MRYRIAILGAIFSLAVQAQQYPFLPVPGSPAGTKQLFQDSLGRLWIIAGEIFCFDGSRFFSLHDYGLPPVAGLDITEDKSGAIWIGTGTGVYRFSNGRVEQIGKGSVSSVIALSPDVVLAAVGPPGRTAPAAAGSSLVRFRRIADGWKTDRIMDLDSPGPLTLDQKGSILYPLMGKGYKEIRSEDVIHWRPSQSLQVREFPLPDFPSNGGVRVMRDSRGCIWIGATGGGGGIVSSCNGSSFSHPINSGGLSANLHENPDGSMMLWGTSIVAVGRNKSFQTATPMNGLPGLYDAIQAADGTIWLAASTGVYRFASPFRIEYWTQREGLTSPPWSFTRGRGKIYAGVSQAIMTLSADRQRWQPAVSFNQGGIVASVLAAPGGSLLASFINGGVVQVDANGHEMARTQAQPLHTGSMRLADTPDGQFWVGGNALGRLIRQGSLLKFEEHPLLTRPTTNVLAVKYEPHTRKLWACYNGGAVVKDENDRWREITTRDGLLSNGCWSLAPLPNGDVWYAYFSAQAFALIRNNPVGGITVRSYGKSEGIADPYSDSLDTDERSNLWRSGVRGVYAATPAQAEAGNWLQLNESDGLPADDINSGSYFNDTDGSLWWGADNDILHYIPPDDLVQPRFAPKVFVSAFSWSGTPPKLTEAVRELPHVSNIVAHIGSLQFERRNALRIRYRVLPKQTAWRESRSLDIPLGSLSSGSHTLEVQGRVFTGPWSGTVSRSFSVLPPIWLGGRFLFAYALAAVLFFTSLSLLRRKWRLEEQSLLPDLAEWRINALAAGADLLTGTTLDDRFEVRELLAQGGFGSVMNAYDRAEQRRCALKIFRGEIKNKASIRSGFEQEVAALRQMRHPNVVSIYAEGCTPGGAPYLAMEFVDGKNLRDILKEGPMSGPRVARLLAQLASALDEIHDRAICHRDLKPENVIVRSAGNKDEQAVLIDFSIAIIKDANETLHGLSRAAGTFDYMAPEQAMGHAQPASDVFSLAKVVIEMLTGTRVTLLLPNASLDLPVRILDVLQQFTALSPESVRMLSSALEFDPAKRPSVASQFAMPIVRDLSSINSIVS